MTAAEQFKCLGSQADKKADKKEVDSLKEASDPCFVPRITLKGADVTP